MSAAMAILCGLAGALDAQLGIRQNTDPFWLNLTPTALADAIRAAVNSREGRFRTREACPKLLQQGLGHFPIGYARISFAQTILGFLLKALLKRHNTMMKPIESVL